MMYIVFGPQTHTALPFFLVAAMTHCWSGPTACKSHLSSERGVTITFAVDHVSIDSSAEDSLDELILVKPEMRKPGHVSMHRESRQRGQIEPFGTSGLRIARAIYASLTPPKLSVPATWSKVTTLLSPRRMLPSLHGRNLRQSFTRGSQAGGRCT
jgi:hypothetical protein